MNDDYLEYYNDEAVRAEVSVYNNKIVREYEESGSWYFLAEYTVQSLDAIGKRISLYKVVK